MRQFLIRVVIVLVAMQAAIAAADDRYTSLTVDFMTSHDSLSVLGFITLAESDTGSGLVLLLNPSIAIHGMYFLVEGDSIKVQFERIGGDTIVVARPGKSPFALSRVLSFDLAFPIDKSNDSLIMLDRGSRWYPVLPHGLTNVVMQVFADADQEVFSTGDKIRHEASGIVWYEFTTKFPVYKIPLIRARHGLYRNCTKLAGSHEIAMYYFSVTDSAASRILDEAVNAFTFYETLIGPDQHRSLTLVEAPGFEGINIGTGLLSVGTLTMRALADAQYESLTLTIAAQWFGAGVFSDFPSRGFWFMSLSLPHYLRLKYESRNLDSLKCEGLFDKQLSAYREFAGQDTDLPLMDIVRPDSREKGAVIYSKGPWLIYQLQNCMSEERMHTTMKKLYAEYLGKVLSVEGFMDAIGKQDADCVQRLMGALQGIGL